MEKSTTTIHSMTRRAAAHDYTRSGIYHITMHVADGLGQPLGAMAGSPSAPDGSPDAPRVELTAVGRMVEHELLTAIHAYYPMIAIQDYVVMPDHLHFLAVVQGRIVSRNGKEQPLGRVLSGFKLGCNRRYWEIIAQRAEPAATLTTPSPAPAAPAPSPAAPASAASVSGGSAAGRPPLFSLGFCDVMPVDAAQLATQRAYIKGNPRSRLLRSTHSSLHVRRGGIATALSPAALCGYLRHECGRAFTPEAWEELRGQLLTAPDGFITCDTFGTRQLLSRPLLAVVCHRRDAMRLEEQRTRCLEAAARGAVLVSARIAKGEQAIIDEALSRGFAVITIADNGLPDRYHPSAGRLAHCAADRLLIVTPWRYQYWPKGDAIHVQRCKAMNCLAQALCRTRDTWWQHSAPQRPPVSASQCPPVPPSQRPPSSAPTASASSASQRPPVPPPLRPPVLPAEK